MLPLIRLLSRRYGPVLLLPFTIPIGLIGYHFEWWFKKGLDQAEDKPSISNNREERNLKELDCKNQVAGKTDGMKAKRTIFD